MSLDFLNNCVCTVVTLRKNQILKNSEKLGLCIQECIAVKKSDLFIVSIMKTRLSGA